MTKNIARYVVIVSLAVWGFVSIVALAGMYKLWWDRERKNYLGKTALEQRLIIWRSAGLSASLQNIADGINATWPVDTHYSMTGNQVQQSYLKYLLIPHIPDGSDTFKVDTNGTFSPSGKSKFEASQEHASFPVRSLIGSFLVICSLSLCLQTVFDRGQFSFPEIFSCATFAVTGVIVISRGVFLTAKPGFFFLTGLSLLCWAYVGSGWLRQKRSSKALSRQAGHEVRIYTTLPLTTWKFFLIGIIVCNLLWIILMSVVVVPDDWDAWAIWGAKAKVLALGHGRLQDVIHFGHQDYPLLWPAVWALSGWFGGGWEEMWSRGWGGIFFFLCIWEIAIIIKQTTGRGDLGLLGGALFASIPMSPLVSSWSYAEAPLWLLTTCCFGCLLRWRQSGEIIFIVGAAVLAAAASYTKNEGVLFVVLCLVWILPASNKKKLQAIFLFSCIFITLYSPWLYWTRETLHLGSHATSSLSLTHGDMNRILHRIHPAFETIVRMWRDIRQWNIVLWGIGILVAIGIIVKECRKELMLPLSMLAGYLVIEVVHHDEISWLVGTSWNRLTLQPMPLLIVVLVTFVWRRIFQEH
jgi:hypothetical protein